MGFLMFSFSPVYYGFRVPVEKIGESLVTGNPE
jgi:hypothetical protein